MNSSKSPNAEDARPHRRISSYGRNRGRKLGVQSQRLEAELLPQLLVNEKQPDLSAYKRWRLEIGFGAGEHLAMQAARYPDVGFIGCEPYITAATKLLSDIEEQELANIQLHRGDARDVMINLPNGSMEQVFILFPDPWPKARHHKRRLINHHLLDEVVRLLSPGGRLLIATDHEDYLTWILEHLLPRQDLEWQARCQADWAEPPADWALTKYQAKALREGRVPHWLSLQKIA